MSEKLENLHYWCNNKGESKVGAHRAKNLVISYYLLPLPVPVATGAMVMKSVVVLVLKLACQ